MKKFVSIILVLVLMLGCCSALAATTEARSANETVTVIGYIITVDKYNKITTSDGTGKTVTFSLNAGTSGTRSMEGTVKLTCGETTETVAFSEATATKVYSIAKTERDRTGGTAETCTVKLEYIAPATGDNNKAVKNNGGEYNATLPSSVNTVVIFSETVNETDPNGNPTNVVLKVTISGKPASAYPGDKYTMTATANTSTLDNYVTNKLISSYSMEYTKVYRVEGTSGAGTAVSTMASDKKSATYEETAGVAGTKYTYWAVAKATITE